MGRLVATVLVGQWRGSSSSQVGGSGVVGGQSLPRSAVLVDVAASIAERTLLVESALLACNQLAGFVRQAAAGASVPVRPARMGGTGTGSGSRAAADTHVAKGS